MTAKPGALSPEAITEVERVFRGLRREVWIITAADGLRRGGLTATWVHPVSLDRERPVLVVALAANHFTAELVEASGRFVANLLGREQVAEAIRFATTSGRDGDKLRGLEIELTPASVPRLAACVSWMEAQVFASFVAGGRHYLWADVTAAHVRSSEPLLLDHELIAAATPDERRLLSERLGHDLAMQRPLDEAWRSHKAVVS